MLSDRQAWHDLLPDREGMGENEFEVRHSLIRLQTRGEVAKQYLKNVEKPDYHYWLADSPDPEAA